MFWRRRNEPEPEPPADLEPAVEAPAAEPIQEPVSEPPAQDAVTPADEAPADADVRPEIVEPADEAVPSGGQLSASPFGGAPGSGGWSAEAMKAAPATLDAGLERTRSGFVARLREALGEDSGVPVWDEVEETLIAGDVGASLALEIVERARSRRHPDGAEAAVREVLADLLVERDIDWHPQPAVGGGPAVLLVVGVNGTGKTTTIGKLAARYAGDGHSLILAAADTFRAAAIDQLRIWAERAGVPVVAHAPNADPGAVVYDALDAAVARGADLVIADTAGRLHTKSNLMDELAKIRRIIDKRLPGAVPETLFVLDATTGQNGLAQARAFHEAVGLTGIVLTKLDSTAKGGIVFAIEHTLGVPVRYVGVGEKIGDLLPFDPAAFVDALFGEAA
ncbi:MAG TPA: signal recognition particle-docking protein FtsY [Clostridia bacterium]|nr:signal recognition particle-docking protein FtsY [Clostridia bacterium]